MHVQHQTICSRALRVPPNESLIPQLRRKIPSRFKELSRKRLITTNKLSTSAVAPLRYCPASMKGSLSPGTKSRVTPLWSMTTVRITPPAEHRSK